MLKININISFPSFEESSQGSERASELIAEPLVPATPTLRKRDKKFQNKLAKVVPEIDSTSSFAIKLRETTEELQQACVQEPSPLADILASLSNAAEASEQNDFEEEADLELNRMPTLVLRRANAVHYKHYEEVAWLCWFRLPVH